MKGLKFGLAILLFVLLADRKISQKKPGPTSEGRVLLHNGWSLSPAGRQVAVGGYPLKIISIPNSDYMVVNSNGFGEHFLAVVDAGSEKIVSHQPIQQGWMGIAADPAGKRVFVSAGSEDRVLVYRFAQGHLIADGDIKLEGRTFPAGLAVAADGKRLYVTGNMNDSLIAIDLDSRKSVFKSPVGVRPYTCALSESLGRIYVSNWGENSVAVIDAKSGAKIATIQVEDKPNDVAATADGNTLFVANGNGNTVSVIDARSNAVVEQIETSLTPRSPVGSTPNALALDPDGHTLFVANADNNAIAVVDITRKKQSSVRGFIPAGWYPTAVTVAAGRAKIVVGNAKGGGSSANGPLWKGNLPDDKNPGYVGAVLAGTLSFVDLPTRDELRNYSVQVRQNSPFTNKERMPDAPFALGKNSPIQHVFFIIKENRTYDQVFGDLEEGNGDPRYCLFPEKVTPNHHALAREYVLLDNFYQNAEVSATGHFWANSAYATDYVEKFWPSTYGNKGRSYRPDYHDDPAAYPSGGFLWDLCAKFGISYRSYGEFARVRGAEPGGVHPAMPSLVGHVNPTYRGADFIAGMGDMTRYEIWMKEFREFEQKGEMPQYQVLSLPGDHTLASRLGVQTPRAFLAENDLALGKIVDAISHSKFWMDTAIFVVEDDAQSGPDHVDCHRTVALVISPYTRRGHVDNTMYSVAGMLRTMEMILGLPPMSQYDASATPMWTSFQKKPNITAYTARQARYPLDEKNTRMAYGWKDSMEMDLDEADEADDDTLNEILWKSIRGRNSAVPPRRIAGFVSAR